MDPQLADHLAPNYSCYPCWWSSNFDPYTFGAQERPSMPILCRHVWGPKTLEASCWIPIWLFNKRTNRDFQKGIPNSHPSCSLRTFEVYFYLRCSSKIKACRSLASPGLSGESTPWDGHCTMLLVIRSVCVCVCVRAQLIIIPSVTELTFRQVCAHHAYSISMIIIDCLCRSFLNTNLSLSLYVYIYIHGHPVQFPTFCSDLHKTCWLTAAVSTCFQLVAVWDNCSHTMRQVMITLQKVFVSDPPSWHCFRMF